MRKKKTNQHVSSMIEHELVNEKILIVDAFETAMRSKPARVSFDQHLIEGHLLNQK